MVGITKMESSHPSQDGWLRYFPCRCFLRDNDELRSPLLKAVSSPSYQAVREDPTLTRAVSNRKVTLVTPGAGAGARPKETLEHPALKQAFDCQKTPIEGSDSEDSNPDSPLRSTTTKIEYSAWGVTKGSSSPSRHGVIN